MTEKTTLGRRIQEGRKAAELSQEALGERLGVSRQAVSQWEADAAIPELENLIAMSRIFGVTVGCLLGVEEAAETDREDQSPAPEMDWSRMEALAAKYSQERRERERKWSRRLAVLGGAAGVCLLALALVVAFHIHSAQQQMERLQSQVDSLRGQSTVVVQPSEEKGELASSQVSITGFDLEAETMTLALSAVPAEKKTDTTAVFSAKLADGTELTQEAESGTAFTVSDWTVPMSDSVDLSVILTSGDQVRTVPLESLSAGREDFLRMMDEAARTRQKQTRVDDALHATRAAVEEGIVPGGGVALIRAQKAIDTLKLEGDEATGAQIVYRAVEAPLRQLACNAGREGALIVANVKGMKNTAEGYNVATDKYEDLLSAGVVDPTKVTRSALQNAASIAGLLLTTECVIADKPEKKSCSCGSGASDMGGMGGMGGMGMM